MTTDDSSLEHDHSISRLIERLKSEDAQAASEIWERFFRRLLPLARSRLRGIVDGATDEEDVLVSVFDRFFRAVSENRFARLEDRDDLWQILIMLTERKVVDERRKAHTLKRGGGTVNQLGRPEQRQELAGLTDGNPTPEFMAAFNDSFSQALARLQDNVARDVALLKLEGYANLEIADRLAVSLSTVERKLRLVRETWESAFQA